jgi:hypothetical protein
VARRPRELLSHPIRIQTNRCAVAERGSDTSSSSGEARSSHCLETGVWTTLKASRTCDMRRSSIIAVRSYGGSTEVEVPTAALLLPEFCVLLRRGDDDGSGARADVSAASAAAATPAASTAAATAAARSAACSVTTRVS